ncbi:M12 family metallopeptidase [Trinickia mobilis]|uniref:M12 family metallopeptidase n=1 Tax=Trinickia mobilis TaxID=2816356 RepID=UPI001A8F8189|nr:M12 family metallopeptidase [Trinickia mobilis]
MKRLSAIAALMLSGTALLNAGVHAQQWDTSIPASFSGLAALKFDAASSLPAGMDPAAVKYTWSVPEGWAHGALDGASLTIWAPDATYDATGTVKVEISDGSQSVEMSSDVIGNAAFAAIENGANPDAASQLTGTVLKRTNAVRPKVVSLSLFDPVSGERQSVQALQENGKVMLDGDIVLADGEKANERAAQRVNAQFWPNGVVPYELDPEFPAQAVAIIKAAILEFNAETPIRFVPRTSSDENFVYFRFRAAKGCWSSLGMVGGRQDIHLAQGCAVKGTVMHEMMHAVGFMHEQKRPDRDNHVTVNLDNVSGGHENNFAIVSNASSVLHGDYDYGSILHYGRYAFSKNNKPTIDAPKGIEIGQRRGFSELDKAAIAHAYQIATNHAPTAKLTGPSEAQPNARVTLDASQSFDPEGDALSYEWRAPQGVVLASDGPRATFTAPAAIEDTPLTFEVKVGDGGKFATAKHTVKVKAALPTVSLNVPETVYSGESLDVSAKAHSPAGATLKYTWTRTNPLFSGSVGDSAAGSYAVDQVDEDTQGRITATVSDGKNQVKAEKYVTVKPGVVAALSVADSAVPGGRLEVGVDAQSQLGLPLTYKWSYSNSAFSGTVGNNPSGTYTVKRLEEDTTSTISVTVSDGVRSVKRSQKVTVPAYVNQAPDGQLKAPASVKAGESFQVDASFTDPEKDTLAYEWTVPAGFKGTPSNSPTLTLVAPSVKEDTKAKIEVMVSDGKNQVRKSIDVEVVAPVNQAPTARLTGPTEARPNASVALDASQSFDPEGDALNYTWTAPEGVVLESDGAKATFTAPALVEDKSYPFEVKVDDGAKSSTAKHSVTVKAALPEVSLHVPATVYSGDSLQVRAETRSPTGKALKYSWSRTQPLFVGTVGNSAAGSYAVGEVDKETEGRITVRVSDGKNEVTEMKYVTVKPVLEAELSVADSAVPGGRLEVRADARSANGLPLTYKWGRPDSMFSGSVGNNASGAYTVKKVEKDTTATISVTVSDGVRELKRSQKVKVPAYVN